MISSGFFAAKVPETGIEPAHPYGRQILSLLRLPIPPPGPMWFLVSGLKLVPDGCMSPIDSTNPIPVE